MAAPSQAVLDDFNRANASTLGGSWGTGLYSGTGSLNIISNAAASESNGTFEENHWLGANYTESEAYVTISTLPNTGQLVYLWVRGQSVGTSGADGYQLIWTRGSGVTLARVINEAETTLATNSQEFSAGDAMGLVALGTGATVTVQMWRRPSGGGWTQIGSNYSDTNASRITTAGRIGLGTTSNVVRLDNFGGGEQAAASISGTSALTLPSMSSVAAGTTTAGSVSAASAITLPSVSTAIAGTATDGSASGTSALALPVISTAAAASQGTPTRITSLYFGGTASGGIDRVRIPLTASSGTVATPPNVGAGSFTYELWLNCLYADNTTSATDVRFSNIVLDRDIWNDTRGHCPLGVTRRSGVLVVIFGANNGSGAWPAIRGTTQIGDGNWHHIAVTRNSSTGLVELWVDGTVDASGTFSTASWAYPTSYTPTGGADNEYLVIGCEKHDFDPGVSGYRGRVDELHISNIRRYTSTFTPSTTPLLPDANTVGLYHVDDASGTTLRDSAYVSGAPTNGELLVGANLPRWTNVSPFTDQSGTVGTAGLTLPSLTMAVAGIANQNAATGQSALTLPSVAVNAAGTATAAQITGTSALALPSLNLSATGTATAGTVTGQSALTLPVFSLAIEGQAGAASAVVSVTLPAVTLNAAGTATATAISGESAITLPSVTTAATGTVTAGAANGTVAITLPAITLAAEGSAGAASAVASFTLPAVALNAAGTATASAITGTSAITLPSLTSEATGTTTNAVAGASALTLPVFSTTATATTTATAIAGEMSFTLPAFTTQAAQTTNEPGGTIEITVRRRGSLAMAIQRNG